MPAPQAQGLPTRHQKDPAGDEPFSAEDPSFLRLVEVAKDPELMREVFQRHLRPLGEKAYQVRECRLSLIRHRQAKWCILEYALRLEEPDTGRERSQWVTGVIHAGGRARSIWEELRRSEPGRGIPEDPSPVFEPFSYVPDLKMLVQVFPHDRRLPALPLLIAGPPPELKPVLLARFGPGDWRAEAWDVELLRYLAETRATLRFTARARDVATGRAEERRFYAKVYNKEEKGEQTYRVLRALWNKAGAGGGAGFTVGRPIAYLSGLRTLLQEEARGIPLEDVLLRENEATTAVRKVARALAALHLDRVEPAPQRRLLRKEVALLEIRGNLLQQACPRLRPKIEETVGAVVAGLEEVPPAPTHCDLKPEHILLDGDRLALVDLDAFSEADPLLDVASVLAHLAGMPLLHSLPRDRMWTVAQAFAEEYFAHVPGAWRTRLSLHYAGAVLKVAVGFLRGQVPGWPDKIEALVEEAKDSVEGRVW